MPEAITASNLTKSYGATKAVDELALQVRRGEFFAFLGPNGAGKTTTIRMLTGIVNPDQGEIAINAVPIRDRARVARAIGVLPESQGFYEWMTGGEYLAFFARLYRMPEDNRVSRLLDQVGLRRQSEKKIGAYSRGMRQRLGIARALINDPIILFLDEPTLGLDPQGQEDIRTLLRTLNQNGMTIFYSSHLLEEVSELCSRIAILNKGRLVAEGTLAELREEARTEGGSLTEVFLTLTRNR